VGYFPFNDKNGDRVYFAEDWARYFADFIGNGIYPKPSNGLQVLAGSGMTVKINPGTGFINGYTFWSDTETDLTMANADGTLGRVDRIVLRWSKADRNITISILQGAYGKNPVATTLTRSADIWEIALADVAIGKGLTTITQAQITDDRYVTALCGICTGLITQIDASTITAQFDEFFAQYKAQITEDESTKWDEFTVWFNSMKDQLSTDAAGNLQNEIDAITEKEFLDVYGLCTKTTSIDKTDGVTTKITESDSSSSTNTITAVTTFTRSSSGETTQIQTVVTPTTGSYYYTKTAVFATTTTGKTITESYTKTAKA
jgi:uncharacterized protein (DUF2267 family)